MGNVVCGEHGDVDAPKVLRIGDEVFNFKADTSMGEIDFFEYLGDSWGILFSHPNDYTPVCTTELGMTAKLAAEFESRNVKFIGLSCNDTSSHKGWIEDINKYNDTKVNFPSSPISHGRSRSCKTCLMRAKCCRMACPCLCAQFSSLAQTRS